MKTYTLRVYKSGDGWRWRMTAANGRIVAESGEAYTSRRNADRAAQAVVAAELAVKLGR